MTATASGSSSLVAVLKPVNPSIATTSTPSRQVCGRSASQALIREALTSYYSLFDSTRTILRTHGPRLAQPAADADLSFGYLALAVLNGALRPVLSRWHPELLTREHQRPPDVSPMRWEDAWEHATAVRQKSRTPA